MEASVFKHWSGIYHLLQVVSEAEKGSDGPLAETLRYAADNAILQHNERKNTLITYEEVRDLNSNFVYSGAGEWAAYSDNLRGIVMSGHDDPEDAFMDADDDVLWILVLMPNDDAVVVWRSPYREKRQVVEKADIALGLESGQCVAYTLPPELEGSIRQDLDPTMPPTVVLDFDGIPTVFDNTNPQGEIRCR
tara:strand:+ start:2023 stop:2598 length:576 start_codon:yes stop_codon:yes gene_type:complete